MGRAQARLVAARILSAVHLAPSSRYRNAGDVHACRQQPPEEAGHVDAALAFQGLGVQPGFGLAPPPGREAEQAHVLPFDIREVLGALANGLQPPIALPEGLRIRQRIVEAGFPEAPPLLVTCSDR